MRPSRLMLGLFVVIISPLHAQTQPSISPARAQSEPPRGGLFVRIGGGLGNGTNKSGPVTNSATGFVGSVHAGVGGRRVEFVIAFDWQAFQVEDPIEDEAVRIRYLLGGVQLFVGRHIYLRPGLGFARGHWSGPAAPRRASGCVGQGCGVPDEEYLAAGLAFGGEWRVWRRQWLAMEVGWRGAMCFGDCSFETRLVGLSVMVPFY